MADLTRDLHDLVRYASLGGASDELIQRVSVSLAGAIMRSERDVRIRQASAQMTELTPGERVAALSMRFDCSRATVYRALSQTRETTEA